MKKIFITFIIFCSLLLTKTAFAENELPNVSTPAGEKDPGAAISPLKKGQAAPFTGVLLSPTATATIITQISSAPEQTKIEIEKVKGTLTAQFNFQLDEQRNILETDKKMLQVQIDAKMKELAALDEELKKERESRPNVMLWAGLGFGSGIAVTLVTALVITKVTVKQ